MGGCLKKSGEDCYCHGLCKSKIGQDMCVNVTKLIIAIVMPVRCEMRIF